MATTDKRKLRIIGELKCLYPDAKGELDFTTPFELLVATILSAQTTDKQVNKVTKSLFKVAGTPEGMVNLSPSELTEYIRSIGLYRNKQKHLSAMALKLIEDFYGIVPKTQKELMTLPGVGQKTANVVVSNAFGVPAIAVDTHVFRVSNRLGLVKENDVTKTEEALKKVLNEKDWSQMHHCLIYHGRRVCKARNPLCQECTLRDDCRYYIKALKK
ncbi:endonuclease III [endosymbiont 'TC1' of Trimyema compressum]|uniref:endonuclease III n=1 Tax=endosymbiont 'TC1' of Trimyema compressum TaxID=243899 RepID=UPI0007F06E72|nr:endonuclease III [endosymbiont 'TC1' of Trimyema compressum]AMP21336.1 endonuclease III [endosymbiont 'TC1' of Trimyema compressum]